MRCRKFQSCFVVDIFKFCTFGNSKNKVKVNTDIAVRNRNYHTATGNHTRHMESHSVTCHPATVTFPPLPQPILVLNLATQEGCKAELIWVVVTSQLLTCQRRSPISEITKQCHDRDRTSDTKLASIIS